MTEAADREGAKLMIAYRLHFDEASVEAIEMVRSGMIGDPRFFSSVFAQQLSEENSRAKARFWANPLPDMGPYPINAARHLFQAEPLEVFAFSARKEEFVRNSPISLASTASFHLEPPLRLTLRT